MSRKVDKQVETFSRDLARRFSRRGLMGRMGAIGIGLAAGGVGEGILASPAAAAPCTGTKSIACGNLYGSNSCPGNACTCGFWAEDGPCGSNNIWADCCGECSGGAQCRGPVPVYHRRRCQSAYLLQSTRVHAGMSTAARGLHQLSRLELCVRTIVALIFLVPLGVLSGYLAAWAP